MIVNAAGGWRKPRFLYPRLRLRGACPARLPHTCSNPWKEPHEPDGLCLCCQRAACGAAPVAPRFRAVFPRVRPSGLAGPRRTRRGRRHGNPCRHRCGRGRGSAGRHIGSRCRWRSRPRYDRDVRRAAARGGWRRARLEACEQGISCAQRARLNAVSLRRRCRALFRSFRTPPRYRHQWRAQSLRQA